MQNNITPFHLAIPVDNLSTAKSFYGELLGCEQGRSSELWVDYNFFGHQLVCHQVKSNNKQEESNPVDGHQVPVPHFGVVLEMDQWCELRDKLLKAKIQFEIKPYIRFQGQAGEQATMFFLDPSGNALEFKAFKNIETELFKK